MYRSPSMQNWTGIGKQDWQRTDFVGMKTSDTSDKMVTQYSTLPKGTSQGNPQSYVDILLVFSFPTGMAK